MRLVKILSVIFYVLCFSGCFYQLHHLTDSFLKFKIRSESAFYSPELIDFPAIDFAIPIPNVLNYELFERKNPKLLDKLCQSTGMNSNGKCNITKIKQNSKVFSSVISNSLDAGDLHGILFNPKKAIKFIKIATEKDDQVEKYCNAISYFNSYMIYMRISCLNGSDLLKVHTDDLSSSLSVLSEIVIGFNFTSFGLRLSEAISPIEVGISKYHQIEIQSGVMNILNIGFTKYTIKSLPSPYESHCRDYNKAYTQGHCLNQKTLNSPKPSLFHATVQPFNYYPNDMKFSGSEPTLPESDLLDCKERAKYNECRTINYRIDIDVSHENAGYSALVILIDPILPESIYAAYPERTLADYLIFVGSILGTWFGVSVISQSIAFVKMIEKIVNYRSIIGNYDHVTLETLSTVQPSHIVIK